MIPIPVLSIGERIMKTFLSRLAAAIALLLAATGIPECKGANTLSWNTNQHLVTADLHGVPLIQFLEGMAQLTG
jgi:hypothetical protein